MLLNTIRWFCRSLKEKEKTLGAQKLLGQLLIVTLSLETLRKQGDTMTSILQGWKRINLHSHVQHFSCVLFELMFHELIILLLLRL
uniref:Uncharacterized protein n=1 Tax=Medicago truncatula TaxID=3880 RepID=B7FFM1_MEDTR|nr:unknown [Medicago truncatula]AFK46343.1 unknown [Medicago truncatula]